MHGYLVMRYTLLKKRNPIRVKGTNDLLMCRFTMGWFFINLEGEL
jgi:hypothetical protein